MLEIWNTLLKLSQYKVVMSKENGLSMLDPNQVIQEVHNQTEKAIDVITANSLVPKRYGKVELDYIESPDGNCREVGAARYYSNGAYQSQTMILHGDIVGVAHNTSVNFYNRTPFNLANTYFTLYEAAGPVTVWFDLDNAGVAPLTGNRLIEVDITSSDTEQMLAQRLNTAVNADVSFFSVISDVLVLIVNKVVGCRKPSRDNTSGLVIKNVKKGVEKQRLDGTFFLLNSSLNADLYYVWFNIDNLSTDPSVVGRTGIEVNISSGASAYEVGYAAGLAIATTTKFITNIDENKLEITNRTIGVTDLIKDVNCEFPGVVTTVLGANRELVAHLVMTYDDNNDLISVERL